MIKTEKQSESQEDEKCVDESNAVQNELLEVKKEPEEPSTSTVNSFPSTGNQEKKIFACSKCNLSEEYDYYGTNPGFNRSIVLNQACYISRDPFTHNSSGNFLLLGSKCAACDRSVCQDCSVYYTTWVCNDCVTNEFPEELFKKKEK